MVLSELLNRYAERFAALGGDKHQVGSPLGAWMVLALAGPAANGALLDEICDALGTDVDTASAMLADLLKNPHPAVAAAMAAWMADELDLDAWRSTLPGSVETGPIPTQAEADEWARSRTMSMIDEFPADVTNALIVLASALATRVTWLEPFDTVPAVELHGPWGQRLQRVLRSPREHGHHCRIVNTPRAGVVAVHTALADHHLHVTSVIAKPDVSRADVMAAAHQIVTDRSTASISLFDLSLGENALWTITESEADERGEHTVALLPAWRAKSKHDLFTVPELGFGAAVQVLGGNEGDSQATQAAYARYSRLGFEAAAVTALVVGVSAPMRRPPGLYRTGTLHFGHPYAVVATAYAPPGSAWNDLPVFVAWITDPEDADQAGAGGV